MSNDLPIIDDFNGDDAKLIESAKSLIYLSDRGAMVPHGIGGHARAILSAFIVRMESAPAAAGAQGEEGCGACGNGCKDRAGCELAEQSPPIPQPAAADGGVRERALRLLAAECNVSPEMVDKYKDRDVMGRLALRAIERALTEQPALSSHRQAGDAVGEVGIEGNFIQYAIDDATGRPQEFAPGTKLYTAPPPGADLSEFRELAERWRANGHPYVSDCADELIALVEKGAGNG